MNKLLYFITICTMLQLGGFSQPDTLKAIYNDVVTNNKELIHFAHILDNLPKGNPENLITGINYYYRLSDSIKGDALLIFLYNQRAFSYFEGKNEFEESFYDKYYSPNIGKIELYNKKLENFGVKLLIITDGYIATTTIPGFIENRLKDSVPDEQKKFLSYYSQQETIQDLSFSESYPKYLSELGISLQLTEDYISNVSFCNEYLRDSYYNSLISFIFYEPELALRHGCEEFNFRTPSFNDYFNNYIKQKPISKTSELLKSFMEAAKDLDEDELMLLYYQFKNKKCQPFEECNCKNENFSFEGIEWNLTEILQCN